MSTYFRHTSEVGAERQPTKSRVELKVDVIIVNWNGGGQLAQCLSSLAANSAFDRVCEIIVVDNASTDDSIKGAEALQLSLRIIRNKVNRGFAAACNQGAAEGSADLILFLNPDTRLFPDTLARAIAYAESAENESVAVFGARLLDEDGKVWRSSARFPTPLRMLVAVAGLDRLFPSMGLGFFMTDWDHLESRDVDHVIGAFYLVRRAIFAAVHGFDERFFVYFEDLDLSYRIRQKGARIRYLGDVGLEHIGGGSSSKIPATRMFYSLLSRTHYVLKHFSWPTAALTILATFTIEPLARAFHALLTRQPAMAMAAIYAHARLMGHLISRRAGGQ